MSEPGSLSGSDARLLALAEAFRAFAEVATDYTALLETVAQRLVGLLGDTCLVMLARDGGTWLEPGAVQARDLRAVELLREAVSCPEARSRPGLAVRVLQGGTPMLLPDIVPEELAARAAPAFARAVRELGIRSFLCVPLTVRGRRLGVLSLFRYHPDSPGFTESDLALARAIADHAALAISNAELFESLERELAERAKAEAQAKTFVALVENSTDMIAMAGFDGRVLFLNAAGRALVGMSPLQDPRDLTLADFHTPSGLARREVLLREGSWQGEGELRHFSTGELIPVQVSSFLVRDGAGAPICFATVQHDLRATKRFEAELRQAHKMEALGRLAGGIAHDFNNLLTVILSYSALLARQLPRDSRSAQDVAQIERAGERAAGLTRKLLAFSRRQVLEPQPVDLAATLRGMETMLRSIVGEDIELRLVTDGGTGSVLVDAGQVEQVVMNLVLNARDAMSGGGVLTLETTRVALAEAEAASLGLPPGAYHTLAVTDTGAGIDAQTMQHLFEPFFTTKEIGKGTGLGLSTVIGIVEQSGGHVAVASQLGRGTTFRVYLPETDAVAPAAVAAPPEAPTMLAAGRILVVEDQADVRALVRDVLAQAGYDVIAATDGEHALRLATELPGEIHLLLTDVIMPKLGGRQLAAQFLAHRPATRVLYMSGYTDDKLGHHGVLDPDVELIEKPLTPDALLRKIRALLTA